MRRDNHFSLPVRLARPPRGIALALLLVALLSGGCVRRRLTVRSNPPGAMVYIDDQQIGTTPVATSFVYYGTRKIKLVKDQFETLTTYQKISPPWYEVPPLDLVSENLLGRELRDERVLEFQLQPQRVVPTQELLSRASNLRGSAQQGFVAPIPQGPATPATPLPPSPPAMLPPAMLPPTTMPPAFVPAG